MIERLPDQRNFVVRGDVLPLADYYDGIDDPALLEADEARIDKIISGIEAKPSAERPEAHALAQGVLFLLDEEGRTQAIVDSINQHPASQNVQTGALGGIAEGIIHKYRQQAAEIIGYKKNPNLSAIKRDVCIAVIRNRNELSHDDLEHIAEELGYRKDYFTQPVASDDTSEVRERDFRERQYKD